ncbi:MAG: hypothetical protein ACRCVV_09045 [Shewanella sp.]
MKLSKFFIVAFFLCAIMLVSMCSALSFYIIFSRFGLYGKLVGYAVGTLTWAIPNITFFYKLRELEPQAIKSLKSKTNKSFVIILMLLIFPVVAELMPTSLLGLRTL